MSSLSGSSAIVTGAASGIGLAAARELLEAGASVLLVDLDEAGLQDVVAGLGQGADACVADVSQGADVQRFVAEAEERHGKVDFLFNNAAIAGDVHSIVDCPEELFDRVIATNLRSVFLGLKYVLPGMIERGRGSVVNAGSVASFTSMPNRAPYSTTKHGILGLTRAAAAEAGPHGVRVNAVCPGPIETPLSRSVRSGFGDVDPGATTQAVANTLGRMGEAREIATVVRFLASDEASFVNGSAWLADGGMLATP